MKKFDNQQRAGVKRRCSSASSFGALAADELESEIKLTRFEPLSQEAAHLAAGALDQTAVDLQMGTQEIGTISKSLLLANEQELANKHKSSNNLKRTFNASAVKKMNYLPPMDGLPQSRALMHQDDRQFQIVWRSLEFDVQTSGYDRAINAASGCLNSLLRLGCLRRPATPTGCSPPASGQESPVNASRVSSTYELAAAAAGMAAQARPGAKLAPASARHKQSANRADRRNVFKNLNGYIKSNEISAILGPSGAGKTSLLNALCGGGKMENYRGSIELRSGSSGARTRRMQLSIIPQKDYLIENLTVRENLLYSSHLLNEQRHFDHEANIMRVVQMLSLEHCLQSTAANISGGEYKRVSIAQELLRQPDILVLDEPTSGLDSLNCKKLIRTLKQLIETARVGAIKPLAVVMTIHQPDIDTFNMFDHVYCMARKGRVIFDGPPSEVMRTIRSHAGFSPGAPNAPPELDDDESHVNPANLLIEIASEDLYGQEPIERLARLQRKQFEQLLLQWAPSASSNPKSQRAHYQLQCNLVLGQQQQQVAAAAKPKISALAHEDDESQLVIACGAPSSSESSCSSETLSSSSSTLSQEAAGEPNGPGPVTGPTGKTLWRDKRLSAKQERRGKLFWYHTRLLAQRSFLSTLRDPLMTMISLLFHLFLPFVMWSVYPRRVGRVNACPVIQRQLDLVSMASNATLERMYTMQDEMTATVECSTMLFITTYALSMCSMTVAALAFPLSMHILLKEVRNGWYDMKTFILAKQIANFPFEVIFPSVTMVMVYIMLDMPSSPYEWRLWLIALVMALIAMISTAHGLIIGTLCMDSVQTAVFLSIASTLPQVMLSGFTARLKFLPAIYRHLSWISVYRYANELMNTIRFGFGICPCDQQTDDYLRSHKPTFSDIPANLKPMFLYYLASGSSITTTSSSDNEQLAQNGSLASNATAIVSQFNTTTTPPPFGESEIAGISHDLLLAPDERSALLARMETDEVDIFAQMAESMTRSLSYGRHIASCKDVKSQLLHITEAQDEDMFPTMIGYVLAVLIFFKILLFVVVKFKVGSRT